MGSGTVEMLLIRSPINSRQRWIPSRSGKNAVDHKVGCNLTLHALRGPSHTSPRRKRPRGGSLVSFIVLPSNLPGGSKDSWDM